MRRIITCLSLIWAAIAAWPCAASAQERIRVDAFAATVNSRVITIGDIRQLMDPILHRLHIEFDGPELEAHIQRLFSESLARLVEREMLAEEFARRELELPERMVSAELSRLVVDHFGGRRAAFLDAMAEDRFTLDDYRRQLRTDLKAMILRQQEIAARVVLPPGEILAEYEQNLDQFSIPARVRIRAMEFRGEEAGARAADATARLQAGEPFEDVARALSQDRRAEAGGDWGWVDVDDLHPDIAGRVKTLEPGDTADPLTIEDRQFLVRLEERTPARVRPLHEVYPQVAARVRAREEQRLRERLLRRLHRYHAVRMLAEDEAG